MLTSAGVDRHTVGAEDASRSELASRYQAYRRRQARNLLHMMPRDAIRPLYRRALAASSGEGWSDPMEALLAYCATLLPLPPLEAWLDSVRRNPTAYLHDDDDSAEAPSADAPVTVATRDFVHDDRSWAAHLRSFRDGPTWRGFIAFEDRASQHVHRTAPIFNESTSVDVRERFLSFESSSLVAFLRSALP